MTDIRYAIRLLLRNPIFSLTAVLSLAIGIGADTTVFTIANALLFAKPVGVVDPARIVDIGSAAAGGSPFGQVSYLNYLDVRSRSTTLEAVYAYHPVPQPMSLGGADGAERISATYVSTNYFSVLGAQPALGRVFQDDRDRDAPIVVLSHAFWTSHFRGNPDIVGRRLVINSRSATVVGVAARGFRGTSVLLPDAWLPIETAEGPLRESREIPWPLMGGRLRAGVSVAQAAAEIGAIGRALAREYPDENSGRILRLVPATPIPGNILPVRAFLSVLMAIVSLVLVTACANVAGVLLARAAARRREIGVRLAMGAGRLRLVRQLLAETTLLFVLGGAAGLLLARAMTALLVSRLPPLPLPIDVSLPLDRNVVLFTAGVALAAALLSGLTPALHASKADVIAALKDESQGPSDRRRLRQAFVVAQVAMSVLLVVAAALFVRALRKAGSIELGFDAHGVELASIDLSLAGYSSAAGKPFAAELIDRVRRLPGVEQAALASTGDPIGDGRRRASVSVPGSAANDGREPLLADWNAIDAGYLATLRIPLLAGRDFSASDRGDTPDVAILGDAAAARLFPGLARADVIGRTLVLDQSASIRERGSSRPRSEWRLRVVGIARDLKYFGPRENGPTVFVYVPLQQQPFGARLTIVARPSGGRRMATDIRAIVAALNPNLPIVRSETLEERAAAAVIPQQVAASLSAALGAVGLLLAAIGIYGVTAFTVAQRTREIGIRVALGARRPDVIAMILRQGLALAAVGIGIGLTMASAAGRLLASFLLGVAPIDAATFAGAAALFLIVGLAACVVPAQRAIRVDPIEALRYE